MLFPEKDYQIIDDLNNMMSVEEISHKYRLTTERIRQIIKRLCRKIPHNIENFKETYILLRKKEIELTARENRIAEKEKQIGIDNEQKPQLYPSDFYLPIWEGYNHHYQALYHIWKLFAVLHLTKEY